MTAEGAETAENLNRITERVIGAAMRVHQALGPGLLESAYEACLAFELTHSGMRVVQQQPLPVVYRDVRLSCGYRLDFIVEDRVIVEVKAVSRLEPIHEAQSTEKRRSQVGAQLPQWLRGLGALCGSFLIACSDAAF
jgi:GxxExxY protein